MMDWMLFAQNDMARLPALIWQQWWSPVGWSVVGAWLGAWSASRWASRPDIWLAVSLGLAAWVWLPGAWGGAHWLGLAFQAPSLTSVLICALLWGRMLLYPMPLDRSHTAWSRHSLFLVLCGVALGWVLLLDTLGVWPVSFYHWGFGAAAPAIALVIAALPWIVAKQAFSVRKETVLLVTAIGLFMAFYLPTGNLFDALIDPWLWCFLHIVLIQHWGQRVKLAST